MSSADPSFFYQVIANPAFSLLTGCIGFFFGHRIALSRDKRKEYNEIADRIYLALCKEKERLEAPISGPNEDDFRLFSRHLSLLERKDYEKNYDSYLSTKRGGNTYIDEFGQQFYLNEVLVKNAIDKLIENVKRK
ncbi:hypothetical protein IEN85_10580 [Pelagicoccus sp. NFK12]|uniref:Uncharacterized protein n=1 Tax=Pelagicoccus enzymogenes TaxID=2773457 RepID=A0A927F7T7_9BACT|nr:hypothetical protein [Pelagicoccus enzymogenes]MBD5779934.1 hypothetical protein [Pelagicoccus enzymogenes]